MNTNSSVEEDSLFGLRQPDMITEGRELSDQTIYFLEFWRVSGGRLVGYFSARGFANFNSSHLKPDFIPKCR